MAQKHYIDTGQVPKYRVKLPYRKPLIAYEINLETRAGSTITGRTDPLFNCDYQSTDPLTQCPPNIEENVISPKAP